MPAMRFRSRTFRRVFVRTPGARTVLHYCRRKNAPARCSETGQILPGVPRGIPSKIRALPKSKRRPTRPYGGALSSKAMRRKMIEKARSINI